MQVICFNNSHASIPSSVVCEVPQDSILGLLLLILFSNDTVDSFEHSCILMFADGVISGGVGAKNS